MSSIRKISKRLVKAFGFSKGWAELALKKPPPLVPSSLMTSCEAIGPPTMDWVPPEMVVTSCAPAKFCTTPPATSTSAPTKASGSRTRTVARIRSTQKLPSRFGAGAGEAAHQRDGNGDPDGGGQEVLDGQPDHLDEVAHGGLTGVRLPVGVGHERDSGVERQPGRDGVEAEGERQQVLHPLEQ